MDGLKHCPVGSRRAETAADPSTAGPLALVTGPPAVVLGAASCWPMGARAGVPGSARAAGAALQRAPVRPSAPAAALPHWTALTPGRRREFDGDVYDPSVVRRVYRDEVYAWEHQRSTGALEHLASQDAWSSHAVPPITLAYSAQGLAIGGRLLHFAIVDGHHRLNADRTHAGVPAMVTHRWVADERGSMVGWRGWPVTEPDAARPRAWNVQGRPLRIHAPQTVQARSVWGNPEIRMGLPGALVDRSLSDLAPRLEAFQPPSAFLQPGHGDRINIRVLLIDVYGDGESSKRGTVRFDATVELGASAPANWRDILSDRVPLRQRFGAQGAQDAQDYPLMEVRIQHSPFGYVDDEL
jgi:hypothetical protein